MKEGKIKIRKGGRLRSSNSHHHYACSTFHCQMTWDQFSLCIHSIHIKLIVVMYFTFKKTWSLSIYLYITIWKIKKSNWSMSECLNTGKISFEIRSDSHMMMMMMMMKIMMKLTRLILLMLVISWYMKQQLLNFFEYTKSCRRCEENQNSLPTNKT